MNFDINSKLQRWEGKGGWFFITTDESVYHDLKELPKAKARGFGAIKVRATIGATSWDSSLFPNNEDKNYILFIKRDVRTAESLDIGDPITATIEVTEDI